jgi:hypothetical protein
LGASFLFIPPCRSPPIPPPTSLPHHDHCQSTLDLCAHPSTLVHHHTHPLQPPLHIHTHRTTQQRPWRWRPSPLPLLICAHHSLFRSLSSGLPHRDRRPHSPTDTRTRSRKSRLSPPSLPLRSHPSLPSHRHRLPVPSVHLSPSPSRSHSIPIIPHPQCRTNNSGLKI